MGDAAGLVDPLTGEGIAYAIQSATLAAEAILGAGEEQYEARLREALLPELEIAARLARRFRRLPPLLMGLCMCLGAFRRRAARFTDLLCGQTSYRRF